VALASPFGFHDSKGTTKVVLPKSALGSVALASPFGFHDNKGTTHVKIS